MARAAEAIGAHLNVPAAGHGTATLSNGRGAGANPVTELCRRHGLWGKGSREKHVPDASYALQPEQVGRFLGVLYACDGHVHVSERLCQVGYTTISPRLACDVQHLLLRLNCVAKVRTLKRMVYEGTDTVAREVLITGQADIDSFARRVPIVGTRAQLQRAMAHLSSHMFKAYVDTLPADVWPRITAAKGERSWAGHQPRAQDDPGTHNWHVGTRGLSRPQLATLARPLGGSCARRPRVRRRLVGSRSSRSSRSGEQETYDLTVPGDHNFVADDIVVHNSALMANIAEHAALDDQDNARVVAVFSLEMG